MTAFLVAGQPPQFLGTVHLVLLGITVQVSVLVAWGIRRVESFQTRSTIIKVAGWTLLVIALMQTIWFVLTANWNISSALPLYYSDILRLITGAALIWQVRCAAALSYYWGLMLNLQAIVTPHPIMLVGLSMGFRLYWVLHIFVFVALLVLESGIGLRPQWKEFVRTWIRRRALDDHDSHSTSDELRLSFTEKRSTRTNSAPLRRVTDSSVLMFVSTV